MTQGDDDAYEANLLPYLEKNDIIERKSKIMLNNKESPMKSKKRKSNIEIDIPIKRKCNWIINDENERSQTIEENRVREGRGSNELMQLESPKRVLFEEIPDNNLDLPYMTNNRSNDIMDINQDNSISEISLSFSFSIENEDSEKIPSLISDGLKYFENLTIDDIRSTVIRFNKPLKDEFELKLNVFDDRTYRKALCDGVKYVGKSFFTEKATDTGKMFSEVSDTDEEIIKSLDDNLVSNSSRSNKKSSQLTLDNYCSPSKKEIASKSFQLKKKIEQINKSTNDLFASDIDDECFEIENHFIGDMNDKEHNLSANQDPDDLLFKPPAPMHSSTPFIKPNEAKKTPESETPKFYTASQALRKLNFQDGDNKSKSKTDEISIVNETKESPNLELSLDMDSLFDTDDVIEGSLLNEVNEISNKPDNQSQDKLQNNNIKHRTFRTPSKIEKDDNFKTPTRPFSSVTNPITRKFQTVPVTNGYKIENKEYDNMDDGDNNTVIRCVKYFKYFLYFKFFIEILFL